MSLNDKQSIYEIYRACRLCGGGAGYKMPIIQSVIDIGGEDTDLKKKISECVQLEVSLTDRMPPLICELCVDKVNDYYEFRRMCHDTNKSIRLRLGLTVQTFTELAVQAEKEKGLLSITEPVYLFSESDEETPLAKQSPVRSKSKPKSASKREDTRLKVDKHSVSLLERHDTSRKRESSPKCATKQSSDELSLTQLQGVQVSHRPSGPKSALRKRALQRLTETNIDSESDDDLLVPRTKKPREVPLENEPPAKKPRLPEPSKPDRTQKAGPKSSKATPTIPPAATKAGPKSKKMELPANTPEIQPSTKRRNEVEMLRSTPKQPSRVKREDTPVNKKNSTLPASKGKKPELSQIHSKRRKRDVVTPQPTSKSKREVSPVSIPKSQKTEVPSNALRSKKRDSSKKSEPSPSASQKTVCEVCGLRFKNFTAKLSHMRRHANSTEVKKPPPPPKPPSASPPQKVIKCIVCKMKIRSKNYTTHLLKSHTPAFTPLRQACDPCELWFTTSEEAAYHHRRHTNGLPYTCTKCYDDFRTTQDFDLHIVRKQCLPTYETPDVKCDECWQMFPTYTLLEQHRCSGSNARPGGKCSKCSRTYTLMKTLVAHEMKCTAKKKVEEPPPQPDLLKDMLPMEVRIVKFDLLLKPNDDDAYDVSGLSHRFGLDRNSSYPYLYSMGDLVKTESNFDHMVSISDDIKREYLNQNDPASQKQLQHWDSDDSFGALSDVSNKTADSLSAISLKTIFSKKCLGDISKTQRKDLDKAYDSVLSIGFGNISKDVDAIIGKLSDESQSDKYDSDSILDKNKIVNVDSLEADAGNVDSTQAEDKQSDKTSPYDHTNKVDDEKNKHIDREVISTDKTIKSESETLTTENEADKVKTENNIDELIDDTEDKNQYATESNAQQNVEEVRNNIIEDESMNDSKENELNAVQSEESNIDNAAIDESESYAQKNVEDEIKDEAAIEDNEIAFNAVQNKESNVGNTDDSQSSEVINYNAIDSIDKDSQDSIDKDSRDSLNNITNITDLVSQNDSQSINNLTKNDDLVNKTDPQTASINSDNIESSTSFKASIFKSIEALTNIDKFNINDLNDDDKLLMNEIDEQIGEGHSDTDSKETNSVNNGENRLKDDNNKSEIQLNSGKDVDLLNNDSIFNKLNSEIDSKIAENERKQTDLRSLDLDNISDEEFNFDI